MENASKALIIAGAIILAILIIGLGMVVFNQARDAIGGANLDSEKATAFNSKFLAYTGSSVTGANARSLIDLIIANNGTKSTTENPEISIDFTPKSGTAVTAQKTSAQLSSARNLVKNASKYTISVKTTNTTTGYITAMTIVEN